MNFTDFSIQKLKDDMTFCYRSGLSAYEETLSKGILSNSGYNTAGYPLNVLTNFPTRNAPWDIAEPFVFNFEIDGMTVCRKLEYIRHDIKETENGKHITAVFESGVKKLRIYEHTELNGTALVKRYFEIENLSEENMSLTRLVLHGGGLDTAETGNVSWVNRPDERNAYSVGHFDTDTWGKEGDFSWHTVENGTKVIDTRFNGERYIHPLIFIRNNINGNIFFVQLAWSAGCRFEIKNNAKHNSGKISLSYNAEITGYKPLIVIRAGEKFTTPSVCFGAVHGGLDEAVNEMNKGIRLSVLNRKTELPHCLIGAGMGAEHDMSVETTRSYMKQMSDMGAEVFIIDAGWVCPPGKETEWGRYNGLNETDKDRYPGNSFAELREYCHSLGMKFGLWMEPERAGESSGIKEKHPEWFAPDIYGKPTNIIDLTVPEAAKWVEDEIARITEEYKLDLLRIDYNIRGTEVFAFRDIGTGTEECLSVRHVQKVYEIYRNLKKRFPNVIFENCAGGGGRTDLGMLYAFDHTWVSDNQVLPRSAILTNGMTLALPPERVDRLFAGMGCHKTGSIDAHMRNTMLSHMTVNVIAPPTAIPNTEVMEFIRHSTDIYKSFIRPMLPDCLIFHHTPTNEDTEKEGACILEVASPDKTKAAITVITTDIPSAYRKGDYDFTPRHIIRPKGISTGKKYKVTLDNTREEYEIDGRTIMHHGIPVNIPSALSSELILIEEI